MVLSYRHGFHTGNIGDVLKQLVLHDVLKCAVAKRSAMATSTSIPPGITYIDTHAGSGLYPLHSSFGRRKREYTNGIMPLLSQQARTRFPELRDSDATKAGSPPVSTLVESYTDKVVELNSLFTQSDHKERDTADYWTQFVGRGDSFDRRRRPRQGGLAVMTGTAMLALDSLSGPSDKAILMDLHRTEFNTLSENVPGFLKVKGVVMNHCVSTTDATNVDGEGDVDGSDGGESSGAVWSPPDVWVSRSTSGLDDTTLRLLMTRGDTDAIMARTPTTKPRSKTKKRWEQWRKKDPEGFKKAAGNYDGGFVDLDGEEQEEEEEFLNCFKQGVKVSNEGNESGAMEMRITALRGGYDSYVLNAMNDGEQEEEDEEDDDEGVEQNQIVMMVDPPYEVENEYAQVMNAVRTFVSSASSSTKSDSTMIVWIPKKYGDSENDEKNSTGRQLVLDIQEHLKLKGIDSLTACLENPMPSQDSKSQLQPREPESETKSDESGVVRGMAGSWVVVVRPTEGMFGRMRHAVRVLTACCGTSAGKWIGDVQEQTQTPAQTSTDMHL